VEAVVSVAENWPVTVTAVDTVVADAVTDNVFVAPCVMENSFEEPVSKVRSEVAVTAMSALLVTTTSLVVSVN
jgi:hypothetical protein